MLDIKMETFLCVAETGSYTRAAEKMHITQPAVTRHIQKLEAHYGCRLIASAGRVLRLTGAGELLLQYGRMQRSNEEALCAALRREEARISVGATLSIADYYLPDMLAGRQESVHVTVGNTRLLLQEMLSGAIDCAFIEGNFDKSLFAATEFARPAFIGVVRAGHPASCSPHDLKDLLPWPLILREEGSGTRAILEAALAQKNLQVSDFAALSCVNSFILIKRMLETTSAISFMYEAVAAREISAGLLAKIDIPDARIHHPMHFVYPKFSLRGGECLRFLNDVRTEGTRFS